MTAPTFTADDMAAMALSFLAADGDRLYRFFDVTGIRPDTIREAAAEPGFAASLLDYILADEALVKGFAAWIETTPEAIAAHRARLAAPAPTKAATTTTRAAGLTAIARQFGLEAGEGTP